MNTRFPSFSDPKLTESFNSIEAALQNLSKGNFKYFELTGTTNSAADTKQVFTHNMKATPSLWFFLEGDVYVPRNGAGTATIDVRSRLTSQAFRMLLIY